MPSKNTAGNGMQDIILARVNALVDEMSAAKGTAEADVNALIADAAKKDDDYAEVQKLRDAYVAAWDALKEKVAGTVDIPSEQDQENAKKEMVEIRKKMRDLYGAIPTILEVAIDDIELPETFTSEVVKQKSKSGGTSIRRPRIDSAYIADSEGNGIRTWEKDVTITKVAEFLEVENAALMVHVPEDLKSHDKVDFHVSPDSGAYKGKQLFVTLIPRK